MMKKRLLLTGASGFLGYNFLQQDLTGWEIIAVTHQRLFPFNSVKSVTVDLADTDAIKNAFYDIKPYAVVHLAAISDANFCEQNIELSRKVNVDVTLQLAVLCSEIKIPFLFTSTDLVFDGEQGNYTETNKVNPLNIYGKQKAEAETAVLKLYAESCVLRMPLMFGEGGQYAQSFMQPFLQKLQQSESLHLFTDEYRSMAGGASAAKGILLALNNNWKGLFHLGGKEKISRYEFGIMLCDTFGLNKHLVIPALQKEVKMAAPRPPDVSLNAEKAFALGYQPLLVADELKELLL